MFQRQKRTIPKNVVFKKIYCPKVCPVATFRSFSSELSSQSAKDVNGYSLNKTMQDPHWWIRTENIPFEIGYKHFWNSSETEMQHCVFMISKYLFSFDTKCLVHSVVKSHVPVKMFVSARPRSSQVFDEEEPLDGRCLTINQNNHMLCQIASTDRIRRKSLPIKFINSCICFWIYYFRAVSLRRRTKPSGSKKRTTFSCDGFENPRKNSHLCIQEKNENTWDPQHDHKRFFLTVFRCTHFFMAQPKMLSTFLPVFGQKMNCRSKKWKLLQMNHAGQNFEKGEKVNITIKIGMYMEKG